MDDTTEATNQVVTRFAPSPTGFIHVGNVRTALYAWLLARKSDGKFILRIEDTDKKREVEGSIEHIMDSLKWVNLQWDEGPDIGGANSPYKQSERLDIYKKYANILIEKGLAYADPYTAEELDVFRKKAEAEKKPFLYRNHRPLNPREWDGTMPLRLKSNVKKYKWHDVVRGDLGSGIEAVDDFILIKSDGYPTYNFAHIIDDLLMGVTHVLRGEEFIASTPNYLSLYEALDIAPPFLVTMPSILGNAGTKKMGKRDGAKDILDYKKDGYLPEAMLNYLAFLGFNPGGEQEIFTIHELIKVFDLSKIGRSGAMWSDEKLNWFNKEHIKLLPYAEIEKNILEWMGKDMQNSKISLKLIPIILERISKWSDVKDMVKRGELDVFFKRPQITDDDKESFNDRLAYKNSTREMTSNNLLSAIKALEDLDENNFTLENVKSALMRVADSVDNRGELLHPVRYALSHLDKSPDPFIIASIIGKNETLSRLQNAV